MDVGVGAGVGGGGAVLLEGERDAGEVGFQTPFGFQTPEPVVSQRIERGIDDVTRTRRQAALDEVATDDVPEGLEAHLAERHEAAAAVELRGEV